MLRVVPLLLPHFMQKSGWNSNITDKSSWQCSAPHALVAMGKVDPMHPELAVDPLGILRPATKLTHQLPLVSTSVTLESSYSPLSFIVDMFASP